MEIMCNNFMPGDSRLVEQLVSELKSQGIFDQFRKECISDVDTKPAYQNLRQRVEGSVTTFLSQQIWSVDLNKNQLREQLRKNLHESGFLETGVERIVDQVVNPKINTVFLPKVEEVVYRFLGVKKPVRNIKKEVKVTITDLLPTDLEAISPESVHSFKTESKKDGSDIINESLPSSSKVDEDESPPFEPLHETNENGEDKMVVDENTRDSHLSGFSGLESHDSNIGSDMKTYQLELSNQEYQVSQNSSESHLSIVTSEDTTKMEICDDSNMDVKMNTKMNKLEITEDIAVQSKNIEKESLKSEEINENKCVPDENGKSIDKKYEKNDERKPRSSEKSSKDKKDDKHRKSSTSSSKDKDKSSSKHSSQSKNKESKDKDRKDSKSSSSSREKDKNKEKSDKEKFDKDKDKSSKYKEKSENKERSEKDKIKSEKVRSDKTKSDKESINKIEKDKTEKEKSKDKVEKSKSDKEKGKAEKDKSIKDKEKSDKEKSYKDKDKYKEKTEKKNKEKSDKDKEKSDKDKEKSDKDKEKSDKDKDKTDKDKEKSEKEKERLDKDKERDKEKNLKEKSSKDKSGSSKDKHKEESYKENKDKLKDDSRESSKDKSRSSSSTRHSSGSSSSKDRKTSSSKKESSSQNLYKEKSSSSSGSFNDSKSKSSSEKSKKEETNDKHSSKKEKDRESKKKSKDDHYSSKIKRTDRRSTDRDSNDGQSSKNYFNTFSENTSSKSENNTQEYSSSSFTGGSGDSSNSDQVESTVTESDETNDNKNYTIMPKVKYMKPKFALNFEEARKIMKIRKQLAMLEKQNQLSLAKIEIPVENGIGHKYSHKEDGTEEKENINSKPIAGTPPKEIVINNVTENKQINKLDMQSATQDLNKMYEPEEMLQSIDTKELSKENWDALEAKLAQVMAEVNYNAYDSDEEFEFHGYSSVDALPNHMINLSLDLVRKTEMEILNHMSSKRNLASNACNQSADVDKNLNSDLVENLLNELNSNEEQTTSNKQPLSIFTTVSEVDGKMTPTEEHLVDDYCINTDSNNKQLTENNVSRLSAVSSKTLKEMKCDECHYLDKPTQYEERYFRYIILNISKLTKDVEKSIQASKNNFWPSKRGKKRKFEEHVDIKNNNKTIYMETVKKRRKSTSTDTPFPMANKKRMCDNTDITPSEQFSLPLSPAESDKSGDRKDEDLLIPTKQKRIFRGYSQRYSSDDLYKPRPMIGGRRNKFPKNTG